MAPVDGLGALWDWRLVARCAAWYEGPLGHVETWLAGCILLQNPQGSWTNVTTGADFWLPPRILPLELLKRSETDALFLPNQILKRFVKKYKDFHQKFPVEKLFLSRSKYFFEVENFRKFSKGKLMKIENFENLNFRFSLIFLWKIFDLEKYFWPRQKYFFDRKFLMKIHIFFYKSSQNFIWHE